MAVDRFDLLGPAWAAVGKEAMRIVGGEPDGVLLYAEIGEGWVEPSLFKDEGQTVRYFDLDTSELDEMLIDAWCIEPSDKRWTAMQYTIDRGKFAAKFEFDDFEGLEEDSGERRERILRARFGDKQVIYPPLSPDAWTLEPPS